MPIEMLDLEAAREEIANGAKLIDVREQNEWDESHIEAALHVPQGELVERLDEVAPDTSERLVLHCRTDNRSAKMAAELASLGYDNVAVVEGGIVAWENAGLPTVNASGLTREQRMRYSRHTLLSEVGRRGSAQAARVEGAAAGRRRARRALRALSRRSRHRHDRDRRRRRGRRVEPPAPGDPQHRARRDARRRPRRRRRSRRSTPTSRWSSTTPASTRRNILDLIEPYDVIVDGADNFPTRYLLNDASVRLRKPVVSASILGFDGQISTFVPYEGPCYRCLYPVPPPPELAPSCGANGVLGVMAGVMGLLQANEVIKLVAGIGEPLVGRLLLYESLGTRFTELKVKRDPACPICGDDAPEIDPQEMGKFPDYELFCGAEAREPTPTLA